MRVQQDWPQDPYERNQPEPQHPWSEDPYGPSPAWRPYEGPVWPSNDPWPQQPPPRGW